MTAVTSSPDAFLPISGRSKPVSTQNDTVTLPVFFGFVYLHKQFIGAVNKKYILLILGLENTHFLFSDKSLCFMYSFKCLLPAVRVIQPAFVWADFLSFSRFCVEGNCLRNELKCLNLYCALGNSKTFL